MLTQVNTWGSGGCHIIKNFHFSMVVKTNHITRVRLSTQCQVQSTHVKGDVIR